MPRKKPIDYIAADVAHYEWLLKRAEFYDSRNMPTHAGLLRKEASSYAQLKKLPKEAIGEKDEGKTE